MNQEEFQNRLYHFPKQIIDLAVNDAVIYSCMMQYAQNVSMKPEDALCMMIVLLQGQCKAYQDELVYAIQNSTRPFHIHKK